MKTLENKRQMENGSKEPTKTKEEFFQSSERSDIDLKPALDLLICLFLPILVDSLLMMFFYCSPQKLGCAQLLSQPNRQRGGGAGGQNKILEHLHTSQGK